ncbi:hypothetical protein E2C01_051526 [Portunus trituberculatus]|uniref:Uncharacterized protein n=1 Tax=Portunus trituberculatus TaxID=210409 RepID=A0A5B7GJD3_PORTR|nr:hypothetical protein [Portunus trituberculatus]
MEKVHSSHETNGREMSRCEATRRASEGGTSRQQTADSRQQAGAGVSSATSRITPAACETFN